VVNANSLCQKGGNNDEEPKEESRAMNDSDFVDIDDM